MTIQEIANRLAELCRRGDFDTAQSELFAEDAVSIEPHDTPAFQKETKGLKAMKEKTEKWNAMVEKVSDLTFSEPLIAGNAFACTMHMHVTMKEHGDMDMDELCVYTVKVGKIISEQFFM